MNTLSDFREARRLVNSNGFESLVGTTFKDIGLYKSNEALLYITSKEIFYIIVLPTGEYYVEFNNENYKDNSLERIEEILWDDYAKIVIDVPFETMEEELHQRARHLLSTTEFPALSLDEAIQEGLTNPFHRQQAHYLMERFDRLSDMRPEPAKEITPEEKIKFAKEMAALVYQIYIESADAKEIQYDFDEFTEPINIDFVNKTVDDEVHAAAMKAAMFYEFLMDLSNKETLDFYTTDGELRYEIELRDYDEYFDRYIKEMYARALRTGEEKYPE